MDSFATQVYEDNDFSPTQQVSYPVNQDRTSTVQIGVLNVGSNTYPIKKGINKIGRHPECNIILTDQSVSKKHAEIEATSREASAWICDLNSSNRTKLNNSVLRPGRCYELKDGSILEFGVVRAVFKVCPPMNDSLIPETPLPSRQKNQVIIPGTPDSSPETSNASNLGENESIIPGTQSNDREPTFRRPSVPQRNSTSSKKKSLLHDSSVDDDSTVGDKENVGKKKVSIHDMETQKQYESQDETGVDIHDVETQKICLSRIKSSTEQDQAIDIHDMETQHEEDEGNNTGTAETDAQYDVDIHDMKTPKRTCTRNVDDNIQDENLEATCNAKVTRTRVRESISYLKIADEDETTEDTRNVQKNSEEYLQLSIATNFEEDCSELDTSRILLGSQNLLEHIIEDEELSDQMKSKLTSVQSTSADDVDEINDKSTDDENIFDAATQVKLRDDCKGVSRVDVLKVSRGADDSDETGQGVSRSYSYDRSKNNEKSLQDQASDDSDTDEEGHFVQIALQERQNISSSSEKRRSDVSEIKTSRGSSKGSEDIFDMLTQHVNPTSKDTLIKKSDDDDEDVDFDAPTQIVHQTEKSKTDGETKDENMVSTQILSAVESPARKASSASLSKPKETTIEDDIIEIEDDVATQIIVTPENTADNNRDKSPSPLNKNPVEENSIEDIDYESAPTQLICEIERKKPTRKSKVSNKVSFNDTLERNLNALFGNINEEISQDEQELSTQVLRNVLQSSQCNDENENENSKSNMDSESTMKDEVKQSTRGRKRKTASLTGRKTRVSNLKDTNTDSDAQTTENYFSALTSTRKRNVLADSEDLIDSNEETSNDKMEKKPTDESKTVNIVKDNVCNSPSTLNSKNSSTPRSMRKNKHEEVKVVEETAVSKNMEDVTNDTEQAQSSKSNLNSPSIPRLTRKSKTEEPKVIVEEMPVIEDIDVHKFEPNTSNDTEDIRQSFKTLYNDDEDIMVGLPEVRISGTLSNPASPTLSTSTTRRMSTREKKESENAVSKKKSVARKPYRKTRNTENPAPYQYISKSDSSNLLGSLSEAVSVNTDVDVLSTEIDEKVNKNSKRSMRNTTVGISQKTKKIDLPRNRESTPPNNNKQESSVRSNGRTRNSSRKNVDRSSIFQVEKEAPLENVTEPVKPSRTGKRSLSVTETTESNSFKKPREDIANTRKPARVRKSSGRNTPIKRCYSANIVNFVTNKSSPINIKDTENSKLPLDESNLVNKQAVINIVRLSPHDVKESVPLSSPVESVAKNIVTDVTNQIQIDQTSKTRSGKSISNAEPRQVRKQRSNNKREVVVEDNSSQGEESQEVEKIMSGSIMEESVNENGEIKKTVETNKKGARTRNTRKRAHTNTLTDKNVNESSVSSDLSESNDAHFEAPTSKSKRTKISKSTSCAPGIPANEEPLGKTRSIRQSSRSNQVQPRIIPESSSEERLEMSGNQNDLDDTTNKTKIPKMKKQKPKMKKLEVDEKQNKLVRENSISSEMNSSIDNASIVSTPNRTRRSMSSMPSPFKTKHKILFTGIPNNDYAKLLTKLGASQVEDPTKCTVLVTDKVRRTVKFLCALAQAVPIVSIEWLTESAKVGHFVDMDNYILKDPAAEAKFGFRLRGSLGKAKEHKLLEGYSILLTPNVAPPPIPELKSIIVSCGGKVLVRPPSVWPQKAVIISREEDLINAKKFAAKAPKTVTIQSTEFILTGILRQELDFIKHKLK